MAPVAAFLLSCKTIDFSQNWMLAHFGVALSDKALVAANCAVHGIFAGAILLRSVVLPSPTILMLGGLTYPLHLLHRSIGYILLNELAPNIGRNAAFIVVLSGMLIASFVVWRFAETPVRKPLLRRLMSVMSRLGSSSRPQGPHEVIQIRQIGPQETGSTDPGQKLAICDPAYGAMEARRAFSAEVVSSS